MPWRTITAAAAMPPKRSDFYGVPRSKREDLPGFQIEIGRALAQALGVPLEIDWIIPRVRASLVDCDILLDSIAAPGLDRGPIKLSHPYQKSGVALAVRPGNEAVHGFQDLAPAKQRRPAPSPQGATPHRVCRHSSP